MTRLEPQQVDTAYRLFYGDGKNLGEVAKELGCGLYDLTPWLTAPLIRIAGEGAEKAAEKITRLEAENAALRTANEALSYMLKPVE